MLEARLRQAGHAVPSSPQNESGTQVATPSSIPPMASPAATVSTGQLASGIGLLSSCAAAEPHYFGFSSGLTLAHFVEAGLGPDTSPSHISLPSLADRPFSKQIPTTRTALAPIPTHATGSKYVEAYLSNVHRLYPFLDEDALWELHRNATNEGHSSHTAGDLARLHLVYAIGSRCIQLLRSESIEKHLPKEHLISAMQHIPEALKFTSIQAVEITLLLALHSMRSPSGASVWHLCGFAMRQALELGLHRPRPSQASRESFEQQRRRLFWSIYVFERKSALVLGRPFAISDKDIEVPMPGASSDDRTDLTLQRHYVLLYRIHSKIRSTLHHLKRDTSHEVIERRVATCLQRLEEWKSDVDQRFSTRASTGHSQRPTQVSGDSSDSGDEHSRPKQSPIQDKTELLLEYYKARRSLLQPLLTEAGKYSPTASDYAACADASGQICQHYRQLHRLSALPFTLRDLHAVVVAGFTTVHCVLVHPNLYDARRANEIGACSTVLYVIAEQWKSAKRYRDAFESVAERLVELLSTTQSGQQQGLSGSSFTLEPTSVHNASDVYSRTRESGFPMSSPENPILESTLPHGTETSTVNRTEAMGGLFGDLFDDSLGNFGMDYGGDSLRDLLASEGLDWFLNG